MHRLPLLRLSVLVPLLGLPLACLPQGNVQINSLAATTTSPYTPAQVRVTGQVVMPLEPGRSVEATVYYGDDAKDILDLGSDGFFETLHTYDTAGDFQVRVKAETNDGDKGEETTVISISRPIHAVSVRCITRGDQLTEGDCAGTLPPLVTLKGMAQGGRGALNYRWIFDDGTPPQAGQTVSHEFADNGTHVITVVVGDQGSSNDSTTITIETAGQPNVQVEMEPSRTTGPAPLSVDVTLRAVGAAPLTLVLNWGDGTTSQVGSYAGGGVASRVSHIYQVAGTYTATVTASDRLNHTGFSEQVFTVR
jgi:PKD repeat protein